MPTEEAVIEKCPKKSRLGKAGVFRNVFSNWGSYALAMGINFFLSPYVVKQLGDTGYGVWSLVLSLTAYLGLLDLGVRGAVTRYIAKFHTEANHDKASNTASSALVIFSTAGLLGIVVSIVIATLVIGRLEIPGQYLTAARIVTIVTGVGIGVSLVNGVYGGVLVGMQRFDLTNLLEIVLNAVRAAAIVAALHFGLGIISLALIQLGFTVARWVANIILVKSLYPELRMKFSLADRVGIKLIFSYAIFSFLLHLSTSLIYASDSVVIGVYLPVTAVTFYVIGGNLVEYTRSLVSGISQTMTPLASATEAKKDGGQLQRVILLSSRAGSMVVLPVAVTFMIRGSDFIGLWMGSQYAELSGKVLWVLSLTLFFWAANSVTSASLLGLSKHKPVVPVLLAEGISNLALSVMWVKKMGILGVAWGTVVPALASALFFWPWYVRRTVGIHPFKYMVSSWLRPMVGIAPFALATYAIGHRWQADHMVLFFLQVAMALPVAALGYWVVCLDREHRDEYSRRFAHSMTRVFERGWRSASD